MATTTEEVVQRLKESRPPVTDAFTYLTIVEKSLSPEILPALEEILEDAELTNDIGWDMVEMLIAVPGSEVCLRSIARLGNPREVILKVLEVMDRTSGPGGENDDDSTGKFITLCGMLGILHKRLQVKAPSRFLHTTLETVYRSYDPTSAESTAAIIELVRSLPGRSRPPLPTRQSSTKLDTLFQDNNPANSAPDPEADRSDQPNAAEPELMAQLMRSFVTCIIEAYVNSTSMEWASRLLEYTSPERIVPGRKTMMQAFKDVGELQARDGLIGQLVAVASDLGLSKLPPEKLREVFESPINRAPLSVDADPQNPGGIKLSTGGVLCLTAYWMFASEVFDAHYDHPDIYTFPDFYVVLKHFLQEEPQAQIVGNPGTVESLVVMAIWLHSHERMIAPTDGETKAEANYMSYHHLLTLISIFHPGLRIRNAATVMAGVVLHSDPDEDDRLGILEDLLENCMFSSLQACAVTWLREEIIAARKNGTNSRFASGECLETLQYTLFPTLTDQKDADVAMLWEFWVQNGAFHLQAANFAYFLFGGEEYAGLAPAGMAAAVELRYVEPLLQMAKTLKQALETKELDGQGMEQEAAAQLGLLMDTLQRVPLQ